MHGSNKSISYDLAFVIVDNLFLTIAKEKRGICFAYIIKSMKSFFANYKEKQNEKNKNVWFLKALT